MVIIRISQLIDGNWFFIGETIMDSREDAKSFLDEIEHKIEKSTNKIIVIKKRYGGYVINLDLGTVRFNIMGSSMDSDD